MQRVTSSRHLSGKQRAVVAQHERQIVGRRRDVEESLFRLAAYGIGLGPSRDVVDDGGVSPLGNYVHVILRRAATRSPTGSKSTALVLAGYRAWLLDGRVQIGGSDDCVFAYDLRYRPRFVDQTAPDDRLTLDLRKTSLIGTALEMDRTVEAAITVPQGVVGRPTLPQYWAGFQPEAMPDVLDNAPTRALALAAVAADYRGETLQCMRSWGGLVSAVDREESGEVAIEYDGGTGNWRRQLLPMSAVLRPYVRVGYRLEEGAVLGDFVLRRHYPGWSQLVAATGQANADWLCAEAVRADDWTHGDLRLRRVEFCLPEAVHQSDEVFEDVRRLTRFVFRDGAGPARHSQELIDDLGRWAHFGLPLTSAAATFLSRQEEGAERFETESCRQIAQAMSSDPELWRKELRPDCVAPQVFSLRNTALTGQWGPVTFDMVSLKTSWHRAFNFTGGGRDNNQRQDAGRREATHLGEVGQRDD